MVRLIFILLLLAAPVAAQTPLVFPSDTPLPLPDDLIGSQWRVTRIGDLALPDGPYLFLNFSAEGTAWGSGGCNSYAAPYGLWGDGLTLGTLFVTRKTCAPEIAVLEDRYLTALQDVTRHASGGEFPASDLILTTRDGTVIELVRLIIR